MEVAHVWIMGIDRQWQVCLQVRGPGRIAQRTILSSSAIISCGALRAPTSVLQRQLHLVSNSHAAVACTLASDCMSGAKRMLQLYKGNGHQLRRFSRYIFQLTSAICTVLLAQTAA